MNYDSRTNEYTPEVRPETIQKRDLARMLHEDGMPPKQIADIICVSPCRVYQYLKRTPNKGERLKDYRASEVHLDTLKKQEQARRLQKLGIMPKKIAELLHVSRDSVYGYLKTQAQ